MVINCLLLAFHPIHWVRNLCRLIQHPKTGAGSCSERGWSVLNRNYTSTYGCNAVDYTFKDFSKLKQTTFILKNAENSIIRDDYFDDSFYQSGNYLTSCQILFQRRDSTIKKIVLVISLVLPRVDCRFLIP